MAQEFDVPPDGGTELEALLQHSGVDFLRDGSRFRLRFSSRGCTWQTVCDCQGQRVLIYGVHPTPVTQPQQALELCSQLNSQVVEGSLLSHWWERLAAGAQGSLFPLESRRSSAVPLDDTL